MTNESRAGEDLGRDAELFRLIVESASDFAIFTTDRASRITTWSTGAERLPGFSEAEVLGQDSRILFTPEDRERGDPEWEMEEALGRDRAVNERWHVRKDGSRFFASGLTMTLKDGPSGPRGFVKIFRDITEQKRAEERLRRALDVPTVGVLFFRLDGLILDANPAFERMSGYTAEELRGLPDWIAITGPEHREATARVAAELAERGETAPYEKEMLLKDGSRWWGLFAPTRLSGTGRDSECVEFITDISDRKELERSLENRLRDLADGDRKKNEFLAMLAHELRNPLAAITSAVRLARKIRGDDDDLPGAHEVIERQAGNLARLIDDLLDVSRITEGKVELKREVVDVPAAIHRAAEAVRPLIEQRRHELTLQVTGGPMHVDADPTRLEQVIGNLLTNAAKYSEEGGTITVSARKRGGDVTISVKDTGVGISPEML